MRHGDSPNSGWTPLALITAILLSCFLIAISRGAEREASKYQIATQETVAPLAALIAVPVSGVEGFFSSVSDRNSAFEENKILKAELAVLKDRQVRYENLAMKVARYEAILGVDTQTDMPLEKIAARAIGETDGPFVRSLLLSVGASDGVSTGNPVLSVSGLVGHVINTGPNTSRVLRLSDLNSRIAVASARSGATAILAGDNSDAPKLSFVNQRTEWSVGDRVISSGDDGYLPKGLSIGEVVLDGAGELRVRLSTHNKPLDWVWVSPFAPIVAPEDIEEDDQP